MLFICKTLGLVQIDWIWVTIRIRIWLQEFFRKFSKIICSSAHSSVISTSNTYLLVNKLNTPVHSMSPYLVRFGFFFKMHEVWLSISLSLIVLIPIPIRLPTRSYAAIPAGSRGISTGNLSPGYSHSRAQISTADVKAAKSDERSCRTTANQLTIMVGCRRDAVALSTGLLACSVPADTTGQLQPDHHHHHRQQQQQQQQPGWGCKNERTDGCRSAPTINTDVWHRLELPTPPLPPVRAFVTGLGWKWTAAVAVPIPGATQSSAKLRVYGGGAGGRLFACPLPSRLLENRTASSSLRRGQSICVAHAAGTRRTTATRRYIASPSPAICPPSLPPHAWENYPLPRRVPVRYPFWPGGCCVRLSSGAPRLHITALVVGCRDVIAQFVTLPPPTKWDSRRRSVGTQLFAAQRIFTSVAGN